jgi:hypothetical protein
MPIVVTDDNHVIGFNVVALIEDKAIWVVRNSAFISEQKRISMALLSPLIRDSKFLGSDYPLAEDPQSHRFCTASLLNRPYFAIAGRNNLEPLRV